MLDDETMNMMMKDFIKRKVHQLYWKDNINCARMMLVCLADFFDVELEEQTISAAIGLHGAGGFRAQCGLVEGALMFLGIYNTCMEEDEIADLCYQFAEGFIERFGSLRCYDLRPNGFSADDPPHMCEKITCEAVEFAFHFVCQLGDNVFEDE